MPGAEGRTVLVAGATGQQGGVVARALLEGGYRVRAMTRDPQSSRARELDTLGAEVVRGDMAEAVSVEAAMRGCHGVFSVQNPWTAGADGELAQGRTMVEVAAAAGVGHFVYSSVGSAGGMTAIPHFDSKRRIEDHLRGSGLTYTILRPVSFMENWLWHRDEIRRGALELPLSPLTRMPQVSVLDIAAFARMALDETSAFAARELDLAGDQPTMEEMCRGFSAVLGDAVTYRQLDWSEFEDRAGEEVARMYRWFEERGFEADIPALRRVHPELLTFGRFLELRFVPALRPAFRSMDPPAEGSVEGGR